MKPAPPVMHIVLISGKGSSLSMAFKAWSSFQEKVCGESAAISLLLAIRLCFVAEDSTGFTLDIKIIAQ